MRCTCNDDAGQPCLYVRDKVRQAAAAERAHDGGRGRFIQYPDRQPRPDRQRDRQVVGCLLGMHVDMHVDMH